MQSRRALAAVTALTVIGTVLRLAFADQSLHADELSTRWMIAGNGLADAISMIHTDAEITPPLYFVLAWFATRIAFTADWLRAPSMIAGAALMPLVYALGLRTVGRRAALIATALTALSPFMIFYATEARAYALVMALVVLSTLALLAAVDDGRARWWVAYAACSCGAVYTHYTSVFALAAQLGWVLWFYPAARLPALVASAAAAVGFLPWLSGLEGDLSSRTTEILSALSATDLHSSIVAVTHWVVGYPYASTGAGLRDLPGLPAVVMLGLAFGLALVGVAGRGVPRAPSPEVVLIVVLALSVPVCEAIVSAIGTNVFSTRNFAASWPALALCLAAVLVAAGSWLSVAAVALAVGAFAVAAVTLLQPDFHRPAYDTIAATIDRSAGSRDSIVDSANLAPVGVPGSMEVAFTRPHRVYSVGRAQAKYDPFRFTAMPEPAPTVVARAAAAAAGGRLFIVTLDGHPSAHVVTDAVPSRFRRVSKRTYPGSTRLALIVYQDEG